MDVSKRQRYPTTKEIIDYICKEAELTAAIINLKYMKHYDTIDRSYWLDELQEWADSNDLKEAYNDERYIIVHSSEIPDLLKRQRCMDIIDLVRLFFINTGLVIEIMLEDGESLECEHCLSATMRDRLEKLREEFTSALES